MPLPNFAFKVAQRVKGMKPIDPSYHSSMFYDLEQRRPTEVNELNERIVSMAREVGVPTPVNELLIRLTREAQSAQRGSPRLSIDVLFAQAIGAAPGYCCRRRSTRVSHEPPQTLGTFPSLLKRACALGGRPKVK